MNKKDIKHVIQGFDELKLHFKTPKHTKGQISEIEKRLDCGLPSDFKKTLMAGYIDKGTFEFLPLERYEKNPRFITFGKWNNDTFLFDAESKKKDLDIYVIASHGAPEKCFDCFHDWLKAVLNAVNRANFPG